MEPFSKYREIYLGKNLQSHNCIIVTFHIKCIYIKLSAEKHFVGQDGIRRNWQERLVKGVKHERFQI